MKRMMTIKTSCIDDHVLVERDLGAREKNGSDQGAADVERLVPQQRNVFKRSGRLCGSELRSVKRGLTTISRNRARLRSRFLDSKVWTGDRQD
jgi:hypothetical protein